MAEATFSLKDKRILIIGGSSGIGFAVAQLAEELGAAVTVASSTAAKVEAAVERLRAATGEQVDLRQESSIVALFDRLEGLDHLVITGGDYDPRVFDTLDNIDLTIVRQALESRFFGYFACIKHGRHKLAPDGSITLTGGMLAHRPRKGAPLPTTVVGAVETLVRTFAVDLAPLRVNGVCPGLTSTEFITAKGLERARALTAHQPIARAATPVEVAQAYIYLMLNGYVTGQILPVEGGGLLV